MEHIDEVLRKYVADGEDTTNKLLGAAGLVLSKGAVIYSGSAGRIDLPTDSKPFDADSLYWIASCTKVITVTAVMQLVESGKLSLHEDCRLKIPELSNIQILKGFAEDNKPILEDTAVPMTLKQMLLHTAGLSHDFCDEDLVKFREVTGKKDKCMSWTRHGWDYPLKYTPGESWFYGSGVEWAGLLIESTTGQNVGQYLAENIFKPLGMTSTCFPAEIPNRDRARMAADVERQGDGSLVPGPDVLPNPYEVEAAGSGLCSTMADFARFFQGLFEGKLVSQGALDTMLTPMLEEMQVAGIMEQARRDGEGLFADFPPNTRLNHSLAGAVTLQSLPGKRRAGSVSWCGASGPRWWIDLRAGIVGMLFVKVWPHGDKIANALSDEFERAVYVSAEVKDGRLPPLVEKMGADAAN